MNTSEENRRRYAHYVNISILINDKDLTVSSIFLLKMYVVGIFQNCLGNAISMSIVNNNYFTTSIEKYQFVTNLITNLEFSF